MDSPSTVFVVDDDQSGRMSVIALVEAHGFACRGFDSATAFLDEYDPRQAGCLVTDLDMTGLDLHRELQRRGWIIPTVVVGCSSVSQTVQAMQQGVISVLEKPYKQECLLEAVRLALDADTEFRTGARKLAKLNCSFSQLTEEVEVLDWLASGKSNKITAAELGVSLRTVELRRQRLFEKLGVHGVAAVVALVVERERLLDSLNSRRLAEAWNGITRVESSAHTQSSSSTT